MSPFNVHDRTHYARLIRDAVKDGPADIDDLVHASHLKHPGFVQSHFNEALQELVTAGRVRREGYQLLPVGK